MSPLTKKSLFWDTDTKNIHPIKHKRYIIERILRFGDFEDYYWMRDKYSTRDIKNVILKGRSELDPKSVNFWCRSFGVAESICTQKLLAKTQELFWRS